MRRFYTPVNDEVKQQIAGFKADAEKNQKKAEDAENRFAKLQESVGALQNDLSEAQGNYERELALHAAVRTDLRTAREESEKANRLRNDAMEEAATLQSKFKVQQSDIEAEKSKRGEVEKEFEKKLEASRAENTLLHTQLEKINEQIEKMQSRSTGESEDADSTPAEGSGDEEMMKLKMNVSELRELVKFVRAEKDAIQGQLESARRSAERERPTAAVARRAAQAGADHGRVAPRQRRRRAAVGRAQRLLVQRLRLGQLEPQVGGVLDALHDVDRLVVGAVLRGVPGSPPRRCVRSIPRRLECVATAARGAGRGVDARR